jgi:hypothetical protein
MQKEFKKGEYIVPLMDSSQQNNWNGWVLKQRCDDHYVKPEIDPNTWELENSWTSSSFKEGIDWRYATSIEINEYNMGNVPCKAKEVSVDISNSYYEIY